MRRVTGGGVVSVATRAIAITIVLFSLSVASAAAAAAAVPAPSAVRLSGKLNGRDISSIDPNLPLRLQPDQQIVVDLTVVNDTPQVLMVRSVNISGRVMELTFFSFETQINLEILPGATETRTFAIQMLGLKGQATGLLPGSLTLLDQSRHTIVSRSFAADVRGSGASVFGVFGFLVAAITGLLLLGALIRLATHRLSIHRWSRGIFFAAPGLGVGLTLTFSLAAFRILLPKSSSWLTIVLASTVVFFFIGYLTPTPAYDDYDDEEGLEAVGPDRGTIIASPVR